jgi:hypothetical protein
MKLTYRGIAYMLPSNTISSHAIYGGIPAKTGVAKYRGAAYLTQQHATFAMPRHTFNLKYRGAYYYPESVYPTDPGLAAI